MWRESLRVGRSSCGRRSIGSASPHGLFGLDQLEDLCRTAERRNVTTIARVPTSAHQPSCAISIVGSWAFWAHVATEADAGQLVRACYFGPLGERSFGANRTPTTMGGSRREIILNASPAEAGVHLSAAGATDRWVPASPTELLRGLKAYGAAGGNDFMPWVGNASGELSS